MADNPDELTFSEGEVIVVDGEEDQEWWVSISHAARVSAVFSNTGLKHKVFPNSLWSRFHHVDVSALGNHGGCSKKPWPHSGWCPPPPPLFPPAAASSVEPLVWTWTSCNLFSSEPPLQIWPYLVTLSLCVCGPARTLTSPEVPAVSSVIALCVSEISEWKQSNEGAGWGDENLNWSLRWKEFPSLNVFKK